MLLHLCGTRHAPIIGYDKQNNHKNYMQNMTKITLEPYFLKKIRAFPSSLLAPPNWGFARIRNSGD